MASVVGLSATSEMSLANQVNIGVHVLAGGLGLVIGFWLLFRPKGTAVHRKWGRNFAYCALITCASATIGLVCFRFMPLFAVLNLLVLYQLVSGWRAAHTKATGPGRFDAAWTFAGMVACAWLVPILLEHLEHTSPTVLYSSLGGLAMVLFYDALRWSFPRRWHRRLWLYEHVYKLVATLFGMLSAFVGNVVRFGQPWSQLAPSVLGVIVIFWFFWKLEPGVGASMNESA